MMRVLLAALALALAVPPSAAAQTGINGNVGTSSHDNRARVDREVDAGRLSQRDAGRARAEIGVTDNLAERYGSDGRLTDAEQAEITNRDNATRSILNAPAHTAPKR